jgi:hypothetical protein
MAKTPYVVVYLSDLVIRDDADTGAAGPSGDLILAAACATPSDGHMAVQKIYYPVSQWYEVLSGQNVLGWPNPGIGPSLPSGRPWGLPIFSLPEARMGDTLAVSLIGLESDSFAGMDTARVALDVLNVVAVPIGTLAGGSVTGSAVGAATSLITGAIASSWDDDVIATHTNAFTRIDTWGIGRPAVEAIDRQDGEWLVRYQVARVSIPYELKLRVRINRIIVGQDLDPDGVLP